MMNHQSKAGARTGFTRLRRPTISNVDPVETLPSPSDLVNGGGDDEACD
jgi:hypothetical protein